MSRPVRGRRGRVFQEWSDILDVLFPSRHSLKALLMRTDSRTPIQVRQVSEVQTPRRFPYNGHLLKNTFLVFTLSRHYLPPRSLPTQIIAPFCKASRHPGVLEAVNPSEELSLRPSVRCCAASIPFQHFRPLSFFDCLRYAEPRCGSNMSSTVTGIGLVRGEAWSETTTL